MFFRLYCLFRLRKEEEKCQQMNSVLLQLFIKQVLSSAKVKLKSLLVLDHVNRCLFCISEEFALNFLYELSNLCLLTFRIWRSSSAGEMV